MQQQSLDKSTVPEGGKQLWYVIGRTKMSGAGSNILGRRQKLPRGGFLLETISLMLYQIPGEFSLPETCGFQRLWTVCDSLGESQQCAACNSSMDYTIKLMASNDAKFDALNNSDSLSMSLGWILGSRGNRV